MTCCGPLLELTSHSDRQHIYLCTECGKQGGASMFPDPEDGPPLALTRWMRIRLWIADRLYHMAEAINPIPR